jgi:soluble lytic murein transglycosylase-like protein
VLPGETLAGIAARAGVGVVALARRNGITDPDRLTPGTLLRLEPGVGGETPTRGKIGALMAQGAARWGIDPALVRAVAWQESGWWQGARSSVGAIGVMQLMPDTAEWLGPTVLGRSINPRRVEDNVEGGIAYLSWLKRQTGNRATAVAAYYQGLGSVRRNGLLGETRRYVASVLSLVGRV